MNRYGALSILALFFVLSLYSCGADDTQGGGQEDGDIPAFDGDFDSAGDTDGSGDMDTEGAESSELIIVDGDKADGDSSEEVIDGDETISDGDSGESDTADGDAAESEQPDGDFDFGELPDPYSMGEYQVNVSTVEKEQSGAAVPFDLYVPAQTGTYPLVVFQHGFTLKVSYYSFMLTQLASHGFVVVAPQMYNPNSLIGLPKTAEEAATAASFYAWLPDHLESQAGVEIDFSKMGLAGHSRGGKVVWLALDGNHQLAAAVAGVDPVDGTGGPLGGEARVIDGPFDFPFPSFVLGSGLGGSCAPEGDNHVQFYGASASPAWHAVITDYGHNDFLNDSTPGCLGCGLCTNGPARAPMRQVTAGLLTAFFKHVLTDEPNWDILLETAQAAPVNITLESK